VAVLPWLAAAGLVTLGWGAGYPLWAQGDPEGFFRVPFSFFEPLVVALAGLPFSITAGWLTSASRRRTRTLGYLFLSLAVLVLAYLSSFSFFGGICLDPGEDACVTTWPTRLGVLAAALMALAAGGSVSRWRAGRTKGQNLPATGRSARSGV
jgi:hypothetical protein